MVIQVSYIPLKCDGGLRLQCCSIDGGALHQSTSMAVMMYLLRNLDDVQSCSATFCGGVWNKLHKEL